MTDKQKYAIKLAINTMDKHFGRHYNTVYVNCETGLSVGYGEAINILSDMLSNADNHDCNCQHSSIQETMSLVVGAIADRQMPTE